MPVTFISRPITQNSWVHYGLILQYRSLTHLRSNSFYTCMIKIILTTFLDAPAYLIQRLLFLSCSSFLRFFFFKTYANMQQVLPEQTGLYRYDE